jgi:hypothetical protein
MSFILLCVGLFLFFVGILRLTQAIWFKNRYLQKWGQVVGFCEEVQGLFSVVLRFKSMNGKEHFLVDREKSTNPRYVMGEFIPLLVSLRSAKHCLLFTATSIAQAVSQILLGTTLLFGYFILFQFSIPDLILSMLFGISIWGLLTLFPKNPFLRKLRNLKISHFLSQMREPLVLDIEQSKLIKWSNNYAGIFAEEKTILNVQRELARFLRPLYFLASAVAMISAVKYYSETQNILKNSDKVGAVYDGSVKRVFYKKIRLNVPVFRYYGPKKQIIAAVDTETPILYNLKPGQKLVAYLPKDRKLPVRLDRGWLNYWQAYLLIALSFFLMSLSGKAKRKLNVKKKKSAIFIRKAG